MLYGFLQYVLKHILIHSVLVSSQDCRLLLLILEQMVEG